MANFQYKALNALKMKESEGVIAAANETEARLKLRELDLITLNLAELDSNGKVKGKESAIDKIISKFTSKISRKDIIAFASNISIMIRGGIPLTEGLLYFQNFSRNAAFKELVKQLRKDIFEGRSFSDSLGNYPQYFDDIFINVTRAGEESGEMDVTMDRMVELYTRAEKIKGKIISAGIYPMIVLFLVGVVLLVCFIFVLPSFADIYKKMGVELPDITKFMMFCSDMFRNWWFITFPVLSAAGYYFFQFIKTPVGKRIVDNINIKLPVLKEVVVCSNISSFISTLGVCFGAGIPITIALNYAVASINNLNIKEAMEGVNMQVKTGRRLSHALAETGQIPDLVMLILATGDESGNLDESLKSAQEYLEKEVNTRIEILMSFMEPLLLLFLGVVVGFVALSIYMPMFSMYDNIGK